MIAFGGLRSASAEGEHAAYEGGEELPGRFGGGFGCGVMARCEQDARPYAVGGRGNQLFGEVGRRAEGYSRVGPAEVFEPCAHGGDGNAQRLLHVYAVTAALGGRQQRLPRYVGGVCGRRGGAVIVSGRTQATQLVFYILEINNVHFCCFK